VLLLGVLALTQSRSAIGGVSVALIVALLWMSGIRLRPWVAAGGIALAGLVFAVVLAVVIPSAGGAPAPGTLGRLALREAGGAEPFTLTGRFTLWERGLVMLLDMPLTGVGLNSFPIVVSRFYPAADESDRELIPHVHSLPLQTALDLGLLGLLAVLAIVVIAVRYGLRALADPHEAPFALGLLLGLLAHGIYGVTDAVALGAKPSPALWAVLGLLASYGQQTSAPPLPASPAPAPPRGTMRLPVPRLAWVALGLLAVPLLVAPLAVNAARFVGHQPDAAQRVGDPTTSQALDAALAAGQVVAWGPYEARIWAARALLAQARGDEAGEVAALRAAVDAAPWDASLAQQLGELQLARGDLDGVVAVWGAARTVDTLVKLGDGASGPTAALWYDLAARVDPMSWRPYAAAADFHTRARRLDLASESLARGLRALPPGTAGAPADGRDVEARTAVAARLADRTAPLPEALTPAAALGDAELFARAARVLEANADLAGALVAAELAAQAHAAPEHWAYLALLWQELGQPGPAAEARRRAAALRS
jgi:tetratricopeptide (TPR) repeat protein